jgi:putative lipoprotein
VYCLLKEQELHHGKLYALGQLVRYEYSGSALTKKTEIGLNPAAPTADPIAFNAQYFSNPIGFIGYDEDNIYIADDGVNIEYLNENWRINGNKNRIAAFNRGNDSLSFSDSGATWFTEHAVYKKPNTKILLWEKRNPAMALSPMNYWTSETGTDIRPSDLLFEDSTSPTIEPADVFCYDQDGNLYILWKDNSNYNVRRFALKEDGTYDKDTAETPDQNLDLTVPFSPNAGCAIAVDISDGKKYLYYVDTTSTPAVKRFEWTAVFGSGFKDPTYSISLPAGEEVTALAANKDGLFAGTRTMSTSPAGYTLSVKKYAKQDGADKGTIDVGAFQPTPTEPDSPYPPYTKIMSAINDLQILDGVLYAVTSKEEYGMKKTSFNYKADTFKNSGKLYKIGSTKDGFPGSAVELAKKDPVGAAGNEVGYGFYRFIAVKYDEAERIRLIIASDGAWGKEGLASSPDQPYCKNADKVLEYDLKGSLQGEQNSGGSFSKVLQESGFEWN